MSVRQTIRIGFLAIAALLSFGALGQATLPATVDYIASAAAGAIGNSAYAREEWHKARMHIHEYDHILDDTGERDTPLLDKAIREAERAMAADAQARSMGRNALVGLESAAQQENSSSGNQPDVQALQEIVYQTNPEAEQTRDALAGDGVTIELDQPPPFPEDSATTPVVLANGAGEKTGINETRVPAGGQTGIQPGTAQLQSGAFLNGLPNGDGTSADPKNGAAGAIQARNQAGGGNAGSSGGAASKAAVHNGKTVLARNRNLIRKQMGLKPEVADADRAKDPILPKEKDIFEVVHKHYAFLDDDGTFFGLHLPGVPDEPPQAMLANNKKIMDQNRATVLKQMHPPPAPPPRHPARVPASLRVPTSFPE